jgi:hypothetical protein
MDVTLRRIQLNIVDRNECVCSLSYPACTAHVLHCIVICGLPGSTTFFHIISKGTIFFGGGGVKEEKRYLR